MATVIKVKRLANPHRTRRRVTVKRRNATKRRRMSPKQIRHFGTRAQKAALKRKRKNPVRRVSVSRINRKRRTRRSNPALVVTLGAMNPRRKRRNKPVAATRKNRRRRRRVAVNPRRRVSRRRRNPVARRTNRRRRSRRNPTRIVVVAPKQNRRRRTRRNSSRRRVTHRRRRNPPTLMGGPLFGRGSMELIGGALVGVTATKFIPTLLPASLTGGIASSNIGRTIMSGIAAVVAGWAGSKVSPQFGQGMLFGGMMQTVSVALNAFLPSVWTQLNPQLGDLMPGGFTVPQNPLRLPPPPMALPPAGAQARMNMNGLARAYGSAF